jgi:hypothetical protein
MQFLPKSIAHLHILTQLIIFFLYYLSEGGKQAILLYAGKDATEEFNMLHKPDVVEKYAPEIVIGTYKGGKKH